ncbi:MAG: ABC transporter ATP-binding protein [Clostridia bacterium]|nr:ABC transporter ATP-binding protein [Clostridia bacterium]
MEHEPIIEMHHLKKYFPVGSSLFSKKQFVHAVDDVDMVIRQGEIVGLVGESGSGKTTIARLILNLTEPTESHIMVDGIDPQKATAEEMRKLRKEIAVVFQDPGGNLNPRLTVGSSIMRPMIIHGVPRKEARERALKALEMVKMDPSYMDNYPAQLSGGQQQRIAIARALVLDPKIMILDEPTSALDISVQAQVLNLLLDLQEQMKLTYLIITHDLNIVNYVCDRVFVMYLGKIVEYGPKKSVLHQPEHPYTRGLMAASPILDPTRREKNPERLAGDPGSLIHLAPGCRFAPRCRFASDKCRQEQPPMLLVGDDHYAACFMDHAVNDKDV